ncbi:MAG TPA: hypothetical protein VKU60_05860, partial [Chloroflexota bacterium]|nr:hypothetical protein [Chloroflexota bacterium]
MNRRATRRRQSGANPSGVTEGAPRNSHQEMATGLDQLRKVRDAKHLSLDRLRETDQTLASEVEGLLREFDARHLVRSLQLPQDVTAGLDAVDFKDANNDPIQVVRLKLEEKGYAADDVNRVVQQAASKPTIGDKKNPLGLHPVVAQQLRRLQVSDISTIAGLTGDAATALATAVAAPSELNDTSLSQLVVQNKLTAEQATVAGFAAAMYQLSGEDEALSQAIHNASFAALGGQPAHSTGDLAHLTPGDWSSFLTDAKVQPPNGTTVDQLGQTLAARFAALHPGVAFVARLPQFDARQLTADLAALAPVQAAHGAVIGAPLSTVATGLSDAQMEPLLAAHERLTELANSYPGLQLDAVLNDPSLTAQAKTDAIARRIGYVQQVGTTVGETDLLRLNLATDSPDLAKLGLSQLGATADEQQMVLKTVQAYQRAWCVAGDVDDAQ